MDVNQYAEAARVSPRRIRALIASGALNAKKVGRSWEISGGPQRPLGRRPLSPISQDALADALHSRSLSGITGQTRARTAARIRALRESDDPASLLADWWGGKKPRVLNGGTSLVLHALRGDNDLVRTRLQLKPNEYLRRREDLADVVITERSIHGLSRRELAEAARVSVEVIAGIERAEPANSPGALRRVLRALEVEPSALPTLEAP